MKNFRIAFAYFFFKTLSIIKRLRALMIFILVGVKFKIVGTKCKVRGEGMVVGANVVIGDFCWIEAVENYAGEKFAPQLVIGDRVAMSDCVHISCVDKIVIEEGVLIGSKVYIGDHSHGSYKDKSIWQREVDLMPIEKKLGDISSIKIGRNCWIGDGAVILAGTILGEGCVVGANSVAKGVFESNTIIGGIPAKVLKRIHKNNIEGSHE